MKRALTTTIAVVALGLVIPTSALAGSTTYTVSTSHGRSCTLSANGSTTTGGYLGLPMAGYTVSFGISANCSASPVTGAPLNRVMTGAYLTRSNREPTGATAVCDRTSTNSCAATGTKSLSPLEGPPYYIETWFQLFAPSGETWTGYPTGSWPGRTCYHLYSASSLECLEIISAS